MAKEIKWENLTQEEIETLTALEKSGKEVYAAPIEIEHAEQLETLGITWSQCRTWYIGCTKVKVHLTPADYDTYKMLLDALRAKHREEYRQKRCPIPGKLKPVILCPESNKCAECPFPEFRDKHKANNLSWDALVDDGYEEVHEEEGFHQAEIQSEIKAVCKALDKQNPKFSKAIVLKEYFGFSVPEIAKQLNETERNIYYYLSEAKKIGNQYQKTNY